MQINYSSANYTPYGGLIIINQLLKKAGIADLINSHLGNRGKLAGYSYADILLSIIYSQLSNGSAIEDIHELKQKNLLDSFKICSADTALNTIKELAILNEAHLSQAGTICEINHNPKLNDLLLQMNLKTAMLQSGKNYCLDMDTTVAVHDKYDKKHTYNKEQGYNPLVGAVGNCPVYIEGRSGNTSPAFGLADAVKKIHEAFIKNGLTLYQLRIDAAGYQSSIIDYCMDNNIKFYIRAKQSQALDDAIADTVQWKPVAGCILKTEVAHTYLDISNKGVLHKVVVTRRVNKKAKNTLLQTIAPYTYYAIVTNDEDDTNEGIYKFYNGRGTFEQNNTSLKNEFNWSHLPCSFLHQNTAFMLIAAMGKLLFEYLKKITHQRIPTLIHHCGIELKSFINKVIAVVGKWVSSGRKKILNLYTTTNLHLLLE